MNDQNAPSNLDDEPTTLNDFLPEDLDDLLTKVTTPEPLTTSDTAPRHRLNKVAAALRWEGAQERAREVLSEAGPRARRMCGRLESGEDVIMAGLAPLMMYCSARLHSTRPQTLLGVCLTLEVDSADSSAIDCEGNVAPDTLLYRVMEFLYDVKDQDCSEPLDLFRSFLEAPNAVDAWQTLRATLTVRQHDTTPGPQHTNSVANTHVPVTICGGRSIDDVLHDIDSLEGLAPIKAFAREFAATQKLNEARRSRGLPTASHSRHMAFVGNPGTGKTLVARYMAHLIGALTARSEVPFVEADRSLLIGEWLGTPALKTRHIAEAALGGVLFIDEAYSLAGNSESGPDRFAQEALDTLVKVMEDDRDDLVVILAGYPEPMERLFTANPGLVSRIGAVVPFPDYDINALMRILVKMAAQQEYNFAEEALTPIHAALTQLGGSTGAGNARLARQLLEGSIRSMAHRLAAAESTMTGLDAGQLTTLRLADTATAARRLLRGD